MSKSTSRFRDKYKKNLIGGDTDVGRYKRAQEKIKDRRNSRRDEFSKQRNLNEFGDVAVEKTTADLRKLKLQKWKEEKLQEKLLKKKMLKPVFKTGVVRHKVGSPYLSDISNVNTSRLQKTNTAHQKIDVNMKKPTGDSSEVSFAPLHFKFKGPELKQFVSTARESRNAIVANKTVGHRTKPEKTVKAEQEYLKTTFIKADVSSRRVTRSQTRFASIVTEQPESSHSSKKEKKGQSTPTPVKKKNASKLETLQEEEVGEELRNVCMETREDPDSKQGSEISMVIPNSEENTRLECPKTPEEEVILPIHYSPFITQERGSQSRRSRCGSPKNSESDSTPKAAPAYPVNRHSVEKEKAQQRGIVYFRSVLNSEIERLETLCQDWLHIKTSTPELSHDVIGLIDAAVGQARLLMSKKFSQFRGLIERCEKSFEHETEDPPVTCSDLDGYWDMTYIQVENIDIRFNKLKKLKENNWTEQDIVPKHKQNTGLVIRKPMKAQVKSSLREMIAAARKKKQQADILQMNDSVEKNVGIFTVRTPENVEFSNLRATPLSSSRSRMSLLQHTLLGEHKRHSRGLSREVSPIIMKVTQMSKICNTPSSSTTQLSESDPAANVCRTPLRLNKTPRKSILKPAADVEHLDVAHSDSSIQGLHVDTEHSKTDTKENEESLQNNPRRNNRRSSRRITRKVTFEGTSEDVVKLVHPMTPFVPAGRRSSRRESSRMSLLGKTEIESPTKQLPSGDLICWDSPVQEPRRVTRQSARLSIQGRL